MRHLLRTCSIAMKSIVGYWLFSTMACFDCFHIKNSHPQIIQEVPSQNNNNNNDTRGHIAHRPLYQIN